jgi:transposase InsO family protein
MRVHANARLTPAGRRLLCHRVIDEGWTVAAAAEAAGCSQRTAYKWLRRFRAEGRVGLIDRSSRPHHIHQTPPQRIRAIERLRRLRFTSTRIAESLHMAVSTVCAVLARLGVAKLSALEPPQPPNRYCRRHPGELVHVDVKKLGRFHVPGHRVTGRGPGHHGNGSLRVGWEAVHVCVDDVTRLAYVEILDDERGPTSTAFLARAVAWFATKGVTVQRVMTDNGAPFRSKAWAAWCRLHRIRHLRTRPYRPRTNGKAERFIQTMLREWAYAAAYPSSLHRRRALLPWLRDYNYVRPHGSLGKRAPITQLSVNNLAGNHS